MSEVATPPPTVRWLLSAALLFFSLLGFYLVTVQGARPAWADFVMPAIIALIGAMNLLFPHQRVKRSAQLVWGGVLLGMSAMMLIAALVESFV